MTTPNKDEAGKVFLCPYCSKMYNEEETKGFESNIVLSEMLGGGLNIKEEDVGEDDEEGSVCERCQAEEAVLVCEDCNGYRLCDSCEDLIHSMGVYEQHKRMAIKDFENTPVRDRNRSYDF